jgi:predicted SAM-dependent methyltransferase
MLSGRKLNLGCGSNKIKDCINIDINPDNSPDMVLDFTKQLPFDSDSFDAVYMFHVIEHVAKRFHEGIFYEVFRVLKPDHKFYLSYPEFLRCAESYKDNRQGYRDFWEATIYGRQLYPSDTHIALMDTTRLLPKLASLGFHDIIARPEPVDDWNTIVQAKKGSILTHEQATKSNLGF